MRGASRIGALVAALGLLLAAAPARAIEPYLVSIGLLGGLGGPFDASAPDPGLSNRSLQLQLGLLTGSHELLQLRFGRLSFANDDRLGIVSAPELSWATVSGEYRFSRGYYESGMFLGIGGYRLRGNDPAGRSRDETALGGTFGVDGEFELNKWLSVVGELAGHYADLQAAKIFGTAQAGLAVHF